MKKLYTTLFALFILLSQAFTQPVAGYFQARIIDHPTINNRAIFQLKAISTVVPLMSTCNGNTPATDFSNAIQIGIKWPVSSGITDVNVSGTNNPSPICPDFQDPPNIGYSCNAPGSPTLSANGLWRVKGLLGAADLIPAPMPVDWVLNQWMTICTLSTTGACTDCAMLDVYVPGDFPEIEAVLTITPIFNLNQTGALGVDYLAAPNDVLPLNLLSFTADKSGTRDALLTWTTANEENTSHFQIQRSLDKKSWYDAGSISAAGFSIDIKNYSFLDYQVYNGLDRRFTVYYRLKMVDLDGRKTLSPIQSVVYGAEANKGREFVIYPNPASDGLQVEWDAQRDVQPTALEFFDIAGKLVYSQVVSDNTNQEYIDFSKSTIQPGLYLLRILNGDEPLDYKQVVVGQR